MKKPISDKEAIIRAIKEDIRHIDIENINLLLDILISESHRQLEACGLEELHITQGRIKAYRWLRSNLN